MRSRTRLPLALALWMVGAATSYPAQKSSIDDVLNSLLAVHTYKQVAISPDGKRVAWVESLRGEKQELTGNSAIYVATLGSTERPRRVSAGEGSADCAEHDISWSPDSKKLAFLSDRESSGQLELYVADARGHTARQLP